MKLSTVIAALRQRCPSLGARVFGVAEFDALLGHEVMPELPAAFVLPLEDELIGAYHSHTIVVELRERIAVVVAIAQSDPRGQAAYDAVHDLRAEIWAALLGWVPEGSDRALVYEGGEPLDMTRERLLYQLDFFAETKIDAEFDGFPGSPAGQTGQGDFAEAGLAVDVIDPAADPNLASPGPDGRVEVGAGIAVETD